MSAPRSTDDFFPPAGRSTSVPQTPSTAPITTAKATAAAAATPQDGGDDAGRPVIANNTVRNELVAFLAEFVGTFLFLFFSLAPLQTAQNRGAASAVPEGSRPEIVTVFFIATAFGWSLTVNCWMFYRISGGMFNPAVSLGLYLSGAITAIRFAVVVPTQLVASIAVSWTLNALLPGELAVGNGLAPETSRTQGLFIEMFLTAQLVLAVLLLAVEKHKASHLAPLGIGLSLLVGHMAGAYFTGAGINPCRSFGPATVEGFPDYHWIYWLGPVLGSVLAVAVWKALKVLEYETANPGQDFDDLEALAFSPPKGARARDVRRPVVYGHG